MELCAIKTAIANIEVLIKIFESRGIFSMDDEYDIRIRESIGYWLSELEDMKQVLSSYLEEEVD